LGGAVASDLKAEDGQKKQTKYRDATRALDPVAGGHGHSIRIIAWDREGKLNAANKRDRRDEDN
jgi:hypothetical protein